jgi:hypothetical protein
MLEWRGGGHVLIVAARGGNVQDWEMVLGRGSSICRYADSLGETGLEQKDGLLCDNYRRSTSLQGREFWDPA